MSETTLKFCHVDGNAKCYLFTTAFLLKLRVLSLVSNKMKLERNIRQGITHVILNIQPVNFSCWLQPRLIFRTRIHLL